MKEFSDAAIEAAIIAYRTEHKRWGSGWNVLKQAHCIIRFSDDGNDQLTTVNQDDVDAIMIEMRDAAAMRAALAAALEVEGQK